MKFINPPIWGKLYGHPILIIGVNKVERRFLACGLNCKTFEFTLPKSRAKLTNCICNGDLDTDNDIRIVKYDNGIYELEVWGFEFFDDDGFGGSDCYYTLKYSVEIFYCPLCGKELN